ncbi:hypothetical protein [Acrocarpospora macrocephala]|uniref:hypothetical protein n=1 Tax=Acrocarpospora macrocephala TaxID=150177 RepID=UPI0012D2A30C|nr:hypothetical protein [Acrocarpospora macrocephala]
MIVAGLSWRMSAARPCHNRVKKVAFDRAVALLADHYKAETNVLKTPVYGLCRAL